MSNFFMMLPGHRLFTYGIVVTVFLFALVVLSVYLAVRDLNFYRMTGEKTCRRNSALWLMGAAMALFTLLFVLTGKGWLMMVVFILGTVAMYGAVGDGVRSQLRRY